MINKKEIPLMEYDENKSSIIEAKNCLKPIDIPEKCVLTFFRDVIDNLELEGKLTKKFELSSAAGKHPVFEYEYMGEKLIVFHPMLGAPYAAAFLEELIALGCKKFIVCGGAGVLVKDIAVGHLVIPTSAVRDEGTSFHYLPPSREVNANQYAVDAIETVLQRINMPYIKGKTWTTDAYYRETREKVELRKNEGCITVEMECSALFAVSAFRDVPLGYILYGGDDLSCDEWDSRNWHKRTDIRKHIFKLAVESCLII
jgi:uridine phosphorylase